MTLASKEEIIKELSSKKKLIDCETLKGKMR
jgi:hypothetical protein